MRAIEVGKFRQFEPLAEAVAKLLHPHAEVVIHDIAANRIAAIYNNFSRRAVGDPSLIENAAGLADGPDLHGPFQHRTFEGRRLKYSSVVLRDADEQAIGLLCINFDVSPLEKVQQALVTLLEAGNDPASLDSHFEEDWSDRIGAFVRGYLQERSRTLETLSRDERVELVRALHGAGAFRGKGAADVVASTLGVSRATIYNYLASAQEGEGSPPASPP